MSETVQPSAPVGRATALWRAWTTYFPGVLFAATIALAATFLSDHYGAPVMLFALLLGMAFNFLSEDQGRTAPGIEFASRRLLRIAVGLLGAQITIGQIMALGPTPVFTVIAGVLLTIGFGVVASRLFGLGGQFGVLTAGAVAICGASAAMAISSVLPKHEHHERDTVFTVIAVTTLSTTAMIVYPMIIALFGLDHQAVGMFLGGTIHDVAQVVGAGYSVSEETGNVATFTKLLRVAMLLPVVISFSLLFQSRTSEGRPHFSRIFPGFLLVFAALVIINSSGIVPAPVLAVIKEISRWSLVTAIAALGMKTSLRAMARVGARSVALMVAETLFLALFVLAIVLWQRV